MLKPRANHPSHQVPSIIQIPKPLHKANKQQRKPKLMKSIPLKYGYGYGCEFSQVNKIQIHDQKYQKDRKKLIRIVSLPEEDKNYVGGFDISNPEGCSIGFKLRVQQVQQPEGDTNQTPILSTSQIKQSLICSTVLPSQTTRTRIRSISQLASKQKPFLHSPCPSPCPTPHPIPSPTQASLLKHQNQLLRQQNQKLKQISDQRKNQIAILLEQIMQMRVQISQIFEDSDIRADVENSQMKEEDQFVGIQRSITVNKGRVMGDGCGEDKRVMQRREIEGLLGIVKGETKGKQNCEERKYIVREIEAKLKQIIPIHPCR